MAHDEDPNAIATERYERRLSEECGQLRVEMTQARGELRTEMAQMRGELRTEMAQLRGELRAEMEQLRGEIRTDMSGLRAEMVARNTALLKWLLVFFVSQTAAIAAFIRAFR